MEIEIQEIIVKGCLLRPTSEAGGVRKSKCRPKPEIVAEVVVVLLLLLLTIYNLVELIYICVKFGVELVQRNQRMIDKEYSWS